MPPKVKIKPRGDDDDNDEMNQDGDYTGKWFPLFANLQLAGRVALRTRSHIAPRTARCSPPFP